MRSFFSIIALFAATCFLTAQTLQGPIDFNNYKPLQCHGDIPKDILLSSVEKYEKDRDEENKKSGYVYDADKDDFLLKSNYLLDQMMVSGKVLFGDEITNYVNSVADKLLANDASTRRKLRFYCLRSEEPNAFSTDQGMVFVTIGMIAQLENEAELAFILGHEITHFKKRHTLNSYLENTRIFSRNERDRYQNGDERLKALSNYNQDQELEADELGMKMLCDAGYSCEAAVQSMFVLQFAHLPFEEEKFSPHFLEAPFMKLPKNLQLDSVRPINFDNDKDDDTYSSHPNTAKRRSTLEALVQKQNNPSSNRFSVVQPEQFFQLRKICRYETIRYQLLNRNYVAAIINTQILQKQDSESVYLKLCIAKALYGISKYKTEGLTSTIVQGYAKKEGEQQQGYFLFNKITAPQLNLVALRYIYNLNAKNPSQSLKAMLDDLADDAINKHEITYSLLKKSLELRDQIKADSSSSSSLNVTTTGGDGSSNYVSKYDKLREEKRKKEEREIKETKKTEASKFQLLAFGDIIDDPSVVKLFEDAVQRKTTLEYEIDKEEARKKRMSSYQIRKEKQRKEQEKYTNAALDIGSIVVVDPFYFYADDRKGVKMMRSENQRLKFCNSIEETAREAKLKIELLNPKSFSKDDVEKYNDLAAINDWLDERLSHEDDVEIIPMESDAASVVTQKYDTEHIYVTGVLTYKQQRENRGMVLLYTILFYPLLPFGIVYAVTPEYDTYYYSMVYNVGTGEERMKRTIHLHSNARNGFIISQMYDTMVQIKNKPKRRRK